MSPSVGKFLEVKYLMLTLQAAILGVIVGFVAFSLHFLIELNRKVFLSGLDNYIVPTSPAEIHVIGDLFHWGGVPLFLIPAIGGLLAGALIYLAAPETAGGGTNNAINAFHKNRSIIRNRVPVIKTIVSAITIGSGGSGGREGPIVQIGSGIGSAIGRLLRVTERDRRILQVCGMSSGMASVFLAPIGGSIFGVEILYKRDCEVEALVPAIIASICSFSVFTSLLSLFTHTPFGTLHVFEITNVRIYSGLELFAYFLLGIIGGVISILYVKTYYVVKSAFSRIPAPLYLKPAIGGLIVGVMGQEFPYVLSTGYGYAQMALLGKMTLTLMTFIVFAKILATSLTVGSEGSGGLFAPAVVIGCMLGGVFGNTLHTMLPNIIVKPEAYMLVGMVTLIAGSFKTPLSATMMVLEMTEGYHLLPALAIGAFMSYLITGSVTICPSQFETRVESPVHRDEMTVDVLENIKVSEAMVPVENIVTVSPDETLVEVMGKIEETGNLGFPVIKDGHLVGKITFRDVEKVPLNKRELVKVKDVMATKLIVTYPDETLEDVLRKLIQNNIEMIPVVDWKDKSRLLGIITRSEIMRAYAKVSSKMRNDMV